MSDKKIVINTNFNVVDRLKNAKQTKTKEWIDYRIDIFMNYTLKGLKLQTNQEFIAYIQYDGKTEDLVKDALSNYDKLPNNVNFVTQDEFKSNIVELTQNCNFLYMTRLDADDIYHKSYVQKLLNFNPQKDTFLLIPQDGYIYDSVKNTLVKIWYNCPTFYTFIYTAEKMKKSINKYRITPYHEPYYYKYPNHEIIPGFNHLWHIHSQGYQTAANRLRYKSNDCKKVDIDNMITDKDTVNAILKDFIGPIK